MKTLHVMLAEDTPTPLEGIMETGETGTWRVNDDAMETVKKVAVWDKKNQRKMVARVTGFHRHETLPGWVVEFEPWEAMLVDVFWANRPKFNRIGFAIR